MNLARHEGLASTSMPGSQARMWGNRGHSASGLKWMLTAGLRFLYTHFRPNSCPCSRKTNLKMLTLRSIRSI